MEHILNDPLFWLAVENSSYRPSPDERMRLDVGAGGVLYNTKESKWHKIGTTGKGRNGQNNGREVGYNSYTLRFHWPHKFTVAATYYSSVFGDSERHKMTGRIREIIWVYPLFNDPPVLTLLGRTNRAFVEEALMYIKLSLK